MLSRHNAKKRLSNFNTISIDDAHESYSDAADGLLFGGLTIAFGMRPLQVLFGNEGPNRIRDCRYAAEKHSGVGLVVNDEDFRCDGVVRAKFERALIGRLLLRVGNVLGLVGSCEFENL